MDFVIGLVVGILVAGAAGTFAVWYFLRDPTPFVVPRALPSVDEPAMTATMTEAFLNQQLSETFAVVAGAAPARGPFQIQLNRAFLDVHPERRATISASIAVAAGPIKVALRPVTEIEFQPQVGGVRIFVTKIQLQGVSIPRAWVDGFLHEIVADGETEINSILQPIQSVAHLELFDLETSETTLVLKFRGA